MKKTALLIFGILTYAASVSADVITSPFYAPMAKEALSTTSFNVYKGTVKGRDENWTQRDKTAFTGISYGLSEKAAVDFSIQNTWARIKGVNAPGTNEDANVGWRAGATYSFFRDAPLLQLKMAYMQQETHHYHGAYKALDVKLQTGYDFGFIIPYIGAGAEIPIAQSKFADDELKYLGYAGAFFNMADTVSLNTVFLFDYDDHYKAREWRVDAELSYLITPKIALSAFGTFVIDDQGMNKTNAYEKGIGGRVRFLF